MRELQLKNSMFDVIGLLLLVIIVAYGNALGADFQFDDYNVIVDNQRVHTLAAWWQSQPGLRPLLRLTDTLNWLICPQASCFVAFNLLLHAGCTLGVFLLVEKLATQRKLPGHTALLTAILFALHPVHSEAVTYISGRSMSLMTCAYLWSLLAYERWRDCKQSGWRCLSLALFICAMVAKETAIIMPATLMLWERVMRPQSSLRQAFTMTSLHWWGLAVPLLLLGGSSEYQKLLLAEGPARPLTELVSQQSSSIFYLISKIFWPLRLCIDPLPVSHGTLKFFLVLLLATCVWAWKRNALPIGFALLWLMLHLLPTNSLIVRWDYASERHLYWATWPLLLVISACLLKIKPFWRQLTLCLILPALLWLTVARNADYRNEVALWRSTVSVVPLKPRAWNNLGYALEQAGDISGALTAYKQALRIDPEFSIARRNLYAIE